MNGVLDIADLSWTSNDSTVVDVSGSDNQAIITLNPQKAGTVTITATLTPKNDKADADAALSNYTLSDTFSLTILDIPVVTVNTIGQIMLNADGTPREKQISVSTNQDYTAYSPVYTWEITEGDDYAELPAVTGDDVMLMGKQAGSGKLKTTLTLLEKDFDSAEAEFVVIDFDTTQEPHQSITISGAPSTMIATDTSAEFSLAFTPDTASYSSIDWIYPTDKFTFNNTDKDRLTLTAKANSVGSYTIEAKSRLDENVKASFNLTVNALVVTVNVASNKSTSISKNETTTYVATFNSAQSKSVSWSAPAASKVTVTSATGDIKNTESVTANTDVNITATVTGTSFSGSKKVTLTPPNYTLAYNANGGSGTAMTNESKTYGVPYTLTQNIYTKTSYRFTGWNSAANGLGTAYTDKQANVNIDPSAKGATVTLYAQWEEIYVMGQEGNPDLMVKFGVKSTGYAIGDISAQDVTDTFNKVSAYIKTQSAAAVNPSTGLGVIQMGDYVNLKLLNVAVYNDNPAVSIKNTNTGNDKLRVMVVGINSYYNKNNNGTTTPHLIFDFKDFPGKARMEATNTSANGYLGSEMRTYLTGTYWPALQTAGVPDAVVWNISRRVANKGYGATGADTIADKLWLPTEREMFGSKTYSNSTHETDTNQGRFAYYDSNDKREKSGWYWLASPNAAATAFQSSFCRVNTGGVVGYVGASSIGGCAPAFAVK